MRQNRYSKYVVNSASHTKLCTILCEVSVLIDKRYRYVEYLKTSKARSAQKAKIQKEIEVKQELKDNQELIQLRSKVSELESILREVQGSLIYIRPPTADEQYQRFYPNLGSSVSPVSYPSAPSFEDTRSPSPPPSAPPLNESYKKCMLV